MKPGDLVRCILTLPVDVALQGSEQTHRLQPGAIGLVIKITYGSNYAFVLVRDEIIDVDKDYWQVI